MNIAKFLKAPILKNICERLLLKVIIAVAIVCFPREEKCTDQVKMQLMYSRMNNIMNNLEPVAKIIV